jgi:hypothetical protein
MRGKASQTRALLPSLDPACTEPSALKRSSPLSSTGLVTQTSVHSLEHARRLLSPRSMPFGVTPQQARRY